MLVRNCDVCDHIIGDEVGYMVDIFRTSMPIRAEERIKTPDTSMELCYDCAQAMFGALNERMTKTVLLGKEDEEDKAYPNKLPGGKDWWNEQD